MMAAVYLSNRCSSAVGMIVVLAALVTMILILEPRSLSFTFCSANSLDLLSISVARKSHEGR